MPTDTPALPDHLKIKQHVMNSLRRYWPTNEEAISKLPVAAKVRLPNIEIPLRLAVVQLPEWASDWGVDGGLIIPAELLPQSAAIKDEAVWQQIDWHLAAFMILEAWHERIWEAQHGPIHSYSFRLSGWDARFWQRAWVNRIALFLREWAAHSQATTPEGLFGPLPAASVLMTHDVDAVEKTLAIRIKQSAFTGLNALRLLTEMKPVEAIKRAKQSVRLLLGQENWWQFDQLLSAEYAANVQSLFHFHADPRPKSLKRWIFDPGYNINHPRIKALISEIQNKGHQIGLHPGFETWNHPKVMAEQKANLESVSGTSVTACRQHWLRFSWQKTWATQEQIGMRTDTTLMFNDRSGFRNASAIRWQPWDAETNATHRLSAQPSVLMDSHLYDYQHLGDAERRAQLQYWLAECKAVQGEIAVLWHPHTLSQDYGWANGFNDLLEAIRNMRHV